ncbi:MAG: NADAR family protein [Planctomycetaceae bacterium]|nr:NADAR family protein [Planctomycetaceae bacterium]
MSEFLHIECFDKDRLAFFDGTQVVVTAELVLFWKPPNPFGQWTISPFVVDGTDYVCAEQYMMAEKARLFGDSKTEQRIMSTDSPREHKKLGKQVIGFLEDRWITERCRIVFCGNVAKFGQNEDLKAQLMNTGDRRLVEASPLDRIWGIGFAADHPSAYQPEQWRGRNLLGETLERVRAHLTG